VFYNYKIINNKIINNTNETVPDDTPSVWDRLLLVYLAPRRRPLARHHRLVFLFVFGIPFSLRWDRFCSSASRLAASLSPVVTAWYSSCLNLL